jgi:transcriptional regulator with XRE-family HTH domain
MLTRTVPTQADVNFATALREAREAAGLSQSRLAARAGYDHSYVSRLESDSRAPTRDAVLSLGDAMGLAEVERDYLLAAAGFLPLRVENLLSSEPVVSEVYAVLNDGTLPGDVREDLRSAIRMALRQAQRAVSSWPGSQVISSSANAD